MKLWKSLSLYYKFAILMLIVGIAPMSFLVFYLVSMMVDNYRTNITYQYEQAADYIATSIENTLDSYNTISKLPYYYNLSGSESNRNNTYSYENFRSIFYGDIYEGEDADMLRERDMEAFLQYINSVDSDIYAAHFVGEDEDGQQLDFHYSSTSTYFRDEERFLTLMDYENWDRETKELVIVPTHTTDYYKTIEKNVVTIARNYFDLRGQIGQQKYVGTLFIDVKLDRIAKILQKIDHEYEEQYDLLTDSGICIYGSDESAFGQDLSEEAEALSAAAGRITVDKQVVNYGLRILVSIPEGPVLAEIFRTQAVMILILAASIILIIVGTFIISKRMTKPLQDMTRQMGEIETGNFDTEQTVTGKDEIGILQERFHQMSRTLKQYIDQSYAAKLRQNEAELTALKSQIYPHFLYNTLEIIRMTALEDGEGKVPEMIEALSEQIHYLIGPVQDLVPLEKELDIVKKYIYLLNCRINGKVELALDAAGADRIMVPKLVLQPVVENAYVHGIKPKHGTGTVMIEVAQEGDDLEISVMDNGVGMTAEELARTYEIIGGDAPGIKNEYNWQSIGLKNVQERIRYLYGEDYGLEIESTVGIGTVVRVRMPRLTETEAEKQR